MMDFFTSFYFIGPVCIASVILAVYIIKRATKNIIYNKLYESQNKSVSYIYDILSNEFTDAKVLKSPKLIPDTAVESNNSVKAASDIIFVDKCGVLLINVINDKGEFDNPKTGEWRYRFADSEGNVKIQKINNPFDATIPQIRIINELLNHEGIYSKCVKRMVVYTQNKVRFTYNYSEIVSIDDIIKTIDSMNSQKELTSSEARVAISAISDYVDFLEIEEKKKQ